jgi:hypothetical protein
MMPAEPLAEHRWLHRLLGNWRFEHEFQNEDGTPGMWTGTESVVPFGDVWVRCEGESVTPGGTPMRSLMTLGFNPATNRYVGTWIGTVMTHQWVYDGQVEGESLLLDSYGPDMEDPSVTQLYRDVIEWVDDGHRRLRAMVQQADGSWNEFMVTDYYRTA